MIIVKQTKLRYHFRHNCQDTKNKNKCQFYVLLKWSNFFKCRVCFLFSVLWNVIHSEINFLAIDFQFFHIDRFTLRLSIDKIIYVVNILAFWVLLTLTLVRCSKLLFTLRNHTNVLNWKNGQCFWMP